VTDLYYCTGSGDHGVFKDFEVTFELVDLSVNDRVRVAKCPVCGKTARRVS